jgi:competence protein ComFB
MELHNTNEDIIIAEVNDIFDTLQENENSDNICCCDQCRMDTACYVLNRIEPRYIVSNRGAVRIEQETLANQQKEADIVATIHEGIKQVAHNKRPSHRSGRNDIHAPVFNMPTIIGRLFNGLNFAPVADVKIDLRCNGNLVTMVDNNWQNPYHLMPHSEGTFTFLPAPILAESVGIHRSFEFSVRATVPDFEEMNHFFKVPVISESKSIITYSRNRTFKLPDLYLFQPGEEENDF